jgi:hypothetical protein
MGGGGNTVTRTELDPNIAPYVTYGLSEAQRLYATPTPQYYPGQTYIGPSQQTQAALAAAQTRALAGSPLTSQAQGTVSALMQAQNPATGAYQQLYNTASRDPSLGFYESLRAGQFENPAMQGTQAVAEGQFLGLNPFFQQAFDPAAQRAQQQYMDTIRQVQSTASRAGRYGSGAAQDLQDRAAAQFAQALTGTAGQLAYQGYGMERGLQEQARQQLAGLGQQALSTRLAGAGALSQEAQQAYQNQLAAAGGVGTLAAQDLARQMGAAQLAPALAETDYQDINKLLQAGQAAEQYQQAALESDIQRFNFLQNLPSAKLQQFLSAAYGSPMGGIQVSPTYRNPLAGAAGGAILGQVLGGGSTGTAAGALLGGLLG